MGFSNTFKWLHMTKFNSNFTFIIHFLPIDIFTSVFPDSKFYVQVSSQL